MSYFLKKTVLILLFLSLLSPFIKPSPAQAGHPELERIFTDLPLVGSDEEPLLIIDLLNEPSLLTPEITVRLKQTLKEQLIKVGFTYLRDHLPEQFELMLSYADSEQSMITSIEVINQAAELPINLTIHSNGSINLHTCFVGRRTLEAFKSIHTHLLQYRLAPYITTESILTAEDHALIRQLKIEAFIVNGTYLEDDGSESLILSYRIRPHLEIEMKLNRKGMLSVFGLHQWTPGAKSRLAHCRSKIDFIHIPFTHQ